MKISNKEKALAILLQGIGQGDENVIRNYTREDYIQHSPTIANGQKGFLGWITMIKKDKLTTPEIKVVRVLEDGDFVILHSDVQAPNRKAAFDVFRFKDGMAAEHWGGLMDHPEKTANGHSMLDGPTEIMDKGKTSENKKFVETFVENVFINGKFDKILEFYHPQIIQHNPFIDNTVPGLFKGIEELQKQGITFTMEKIHKVWGEGNFVLTLTEGKFIGNPYGFFDMFRVENGKIVEHWDVLQEIPKKMSHENSLF